jgi:hypothetical protein
VTLKREAMSARAEPPTAGGKARASEERLAALFVCFGGKKSAAKARRLLERQLRSGGNHVFDTTVLQVDDKHKARVHDPHRVVAGALTATLTWAVFGLITGGVVSMISSAALGALWGGAVAYFAIHHASKAQLGRLGSQLPAPSSALLTYAKAPQPVDALAATARVAPARVSVAVIGDDLAAQVYTGSVEELVELPPTPPPARSRLSMILTRYPDTQTAPEIAARIAADHETPFEVELVVQTDRSGRRRVTDPKFGSSAIARANVPGWAGLGLICGAIAGFTAGGVFGVLQSGLLTGVVWGAFGLGAGALYGLWAGRGITRKRNENRSGGCDRRTMPRHSPARATDGVRPEGDL